MKYSEHFVLIRGLLRETRHWGGFTEYLQQQFPHANIIMLDIPGNGRLHDVTSPKTIAGMTEALREKVSNNQPFRLIALSMGGMIAIDWMMRYPDEVEAAVLINTSARPLSPFYHRLRWAIYPHVIKMIFRSSLQKESDILTLTSNRHSHNSKLLATWQQWQQENPVSTVSARNQFLAALKFSVTSKPKQPVLIVASRADRLVDYRCSLKLAQTWQTNYMQHDTAGHDLSLDEPEWLANIIKQWFNSDFSSTAGI
ncbi:MULTISPECIES: alpha/beta fold hydrolase [Nitrosomonas]|uniref:Alpha/beta hydrolase n=1 Tax=Nitrosomonas communis TaxID=44574 RepID=A0A0F7KEH7_9PROT|nr:MULTISPECIES: alpha/beta hydrolase [Nitrosomonas]AKH38860.1 alpha/beta hydrolase [Nitrosomonas communis]TYP88252.1 pimeloyl-ACP methyl ester carboxylesterase [Nitrosomonas communis]UVS60984.1 alpha/beta hydrolase [Nitrosomonas sp. PLL12]